VETTAQWFSPFQSDGSLVDATMNTCSQFCWLFYI